MMTLMCRPIHNLMIWLSILAGIIHKSSGTAASRPNIVLILADDLGWNDVGYNNPDMLTPNLDTLATQGLILNQSYMQALCSPSRSAILTGMYPFRLGLQHLVILEQQDVCLPLDKRLLPQVLQNHGYYTHMVGKWHLGFCNWRCTPTYRGFHSFYGYYSSYEDYYNKTVYGGYDFRFNLTIDRDAAGEYSTFQFARRAKDIIKYHNDKYPLFLYLAFQSVHFPLQVPDKYSDMYPNVTREDRKIFSGMVTAMDEAIGDVVTALKAKGLYNNTLIVFSSDNGGSPPDGGNNYPLRGAKTSVFEGGNRVPSFIHGPMLTNSGATHDSMIHAVDWFPTLVEAAGINYTDPDQDGVSQWSALSTGDTSPRNEFVYNLDKSITAPQGTAAIRVGDYKLIDGYPGLYQTWYHPDDTDQGLNISMSLDAFQSQSKPEIFDPLKEYKYLFNLKTDPEEQHNLYRQMPLKVKELREKLNAYLSDYVTANFPAANPKSNPDFYYGVWYPGWCFF